MDKTLSLLLEKAFSQEDAVEADEARIVLRFLLEWIDQERPVERRGEFSGLLSSKILSNEFSWIKLIDLELGQREIEWIVEALEKRFLTQDSDWLHVPYVLRGIKLHISVQSLMSKYLAEFRELDPKLTHVIECDYFFKNDDASEQEKSPTKSSTMKVSDGRKRIFISYSSEDTLVANAFVDLIQVGMGAGEDEVFHTWQPVQSVGAGENTIEAIRKYLRSSEVAIVLITQNYIASVFSRIELNELSGGSKKIIPVLFSPLEQQNIEENGLTVVTPSVQLVKANNRDDLDKLYEQLKPHIAKPNDVAIWNIAVLQFMQKLA